MKKKYITPVLTFVKIEPEQFLAGSFAYDKNQNTSGGNVTEMDAKEFFDFEYELDALAYDF